MYNIGRYTYLIDAQLDQLKLSQHGVESFIADEYICTMQWLYTDAVGGIRLQVFESEAERAIEVFKSFEEDTSDVIHCQKCKSADTFRMKMSFWSFPLYLIGMFFPLPSNKIICMTCGAKTLLKTRSILNEEQSAK